MTRSSVDLLEPSSRERASLRIASVPASHVYVRHLSAFDGGDAVVRLPDPPPADGRKVPGGWWPPVMLDPLWIRRNHTRFDVFHVHFGFDTVAPDVLADIVGELRDHGKPLVYTVHDLRNPHQPDPRGHREQLDVLIPAADALITLTPGAAEQIEKHWGRTASVLSHPHVVERELVCAPRPPQEEFTVGVHVKSLRANMDPLPVVDTLAETVRTLPGAVLEVNVHDELFEPGNHWYNPDAGAALVDYGRRPNVRVRVHAYYSDDELWQYLSSLSVSVLPYRFGTHSGWLEACYDLGTAVVAPSCGFYDQQRHCETYVFDEQRFEPATLDRAVRAAYDAKPQRAQWPERYAERRRLAAAHRDIYEKVSAP
ncbi:glycosyl transferase family 4 [Nocardia tenerifensis]|uniref:Glycosyl transferase family 4 n=1 Tax=Nocardia tenerifensis TaxID=228006 RepID=A0A318JXG9_9NOCA|nr:glycosyltransferase [Nocardia tenerifensis]PXX61668.1 glycosyl transferase family 4 [Nocardia tenerifensis]